MGVYACSVVTAVTAQNASALSRVQVMPVDLVEDQLQAVLAGFDIAVIKLGMLGSIDIALCVAEMLGRTGIPAVIDPVIHASVGGRLAAGNSTDEAWLKVYREQLMPHATVFTPNLDEAEKLLGNKCVGSHEYYEAQARALVALGAHAVLLKGGHSGDPRLSTDYLAINLPSSSTKEVGITPKTMRCSIAAGGEISVQTFAATRLLTPHGHGTGCTLASAIAAGLAQGLTIPQAIATAKNYLHSSLMHAGRLGLVPANGPVHHFSSFW
jgi:hydroxymethylpyrimidine/phosphomethylpyrimidine kinase